MPNLTPFLKAYAVYRNAQLTAQNPAETQLEQLFNLIRKAKNTKFGKEHSFDKIRNLTQYQERVRLRKYDDFWNEYWKPTFPIVENSTWPGLVSYYCWSSGTTTGNRKFIPYSKEMAKSYNKAGIDLLVHHIRNRPKSKILGGKSFMLGGTTTTTQEAPGVHIGEVSGFSAMHLPSWANLFFFPPRNLTDISDWMERTEKIAQASRKEDIRLLGGMPSWLLIFLEKFKDMGPLSEGFITRLYPNLEMFVHGGVKFDSYLKQYKSLLSGSHAEFREVYPASEAFMAVGDRGYGEGLRLVLDHNIFYEFVPLEELGSSNPKRHWIANVEKDVNYAVILTTCAGAWSYILGDTVRFVDLKPHRVLVTGRTAYNMSAFGEHLIQEELEKAISTAADSINASVTDFTIGVEIVGEAGNLGQHVYVVEFSSEVKDPQLIEKFIKTVDQTLLSINDDYADHRALGCGLNPPKIKVMPSGGFAKWMQSRGKLGDQHKVPRVITDKVLFESLIG